MHQTAHDSRRRALPGAAACASGDGCERRGDEDQPANLDPMSKTSNVIGIDSGGRLTCASAPAKPVCASDRSVVESW